VSERSRRRRNDDDEDDRRRRTPYGSPSLAGAASTPTTPLSPISGFEPALPLGGFEPSPPPPDGSSAPSASAGAGEAAASETPAPLMKEPPEIDDHDPETSACVELDCPRGCAQYRLMLALEAERATVARLQRELALEVSARRTAQAQAEHLRIQMEAERAVWREKEAIADRAEKDCLWFAHKLHEERSQRDHKEGHLLSILERTEAENRDLRARAGMPHEVERRSARGLVMTSPNEPDGWIRTAPREEPPYIPRFNSSAEADAYDAENERRTASQPGYRRRGLASSASAPSIGPSTTAPGPRSDPATATPPSAPATSPSAGSTPPTSSSSSTSASSAQTTPTSPPSASPPSASPPSASPPSVDIPPPA
jgi:hypothetical protein